VPSDFAKEGPRLAGRKNQETGCGRFGFGLFRTLVDWCPKLVTVTGWKIGVATPPTSTVIGFPFASTIGTPLLTTTAVPLIGELPAKPTELYSHSVRLGLSAFRVASTSISAFFKFKVVPAVLAA
jgi:hypothetical protein